MGFGGSTVLQEGAEEEIAAGEKIRHISKKSDTKKKETETQKNNLPVHEQGQERLWICLPASCRWLAKKTRPKSQSRRETLVRPRDKTTSYGAVFQHAHSRTNAINNIYDVNNNRIKKLKRAFLPKGVQQCARQKRKQKTSASVRVSQDPHIVHRLKIVALLEGRREKDSVAFQSGYDTIFLRIVVNAGGLP